MNRLTVATGVLLFVIGVLVGNFLPTRRALAQDRPQEQSDWIIERAKDTAHFDAYIFNTRTGEAFFVQERTKSPVTLKP
jgi:hypothetical protein